MADITINSADKQGNSKGIGYGRPPKGKPFQKGRSGNPKGRPKNRTLLEAIREELAKRTETPGAKGLKLDEVAKAYVDAMIGGSFPHSKEVIEREDGAVAEDVRVEIVWRKPGHAKDSEN